MLVAILFACLSQSFSETNVTYAPTVITNTQEIFDLKRISGGGVTGPIDFGIGVAFIGDVTGVALWAAGGSLAGYDLSTSTLLMGIGTIVMVPSGLLYNFCLWQREQELKGKGVAFTSSVDGTSWGLETATVCCVGASIVSGLVIQGLPGFIVSLVFDAGAYCLEYANLITLRTQWGNELYYAFKKNNLSLDEVRIRPVLTMDWNQKTRSPDYLAGVSISL